MALWLDVEDLFHYGANNRRPSGIQRLSFELYRELNAICGSEVHFCRHDTVAGTLRTVPWQALDTLFHRLLEPDAGRGAPTRSGPARLSAARQALRRAAAFLPLPVREPLAQAFASQRMAVAAQVNTVRYAARAAASVPAALRGRIMPNGAGPGEAFQSLDIRDHGRAGDVIAVLGSPWFHAGYARFIGGLARPRGMRTALLVYDLIPLVRPEWCDQALVEAFVAWFTAFAAEADTLFSISDATARDVLRWSARSGIAVRQPIMTLPVGTGFAERPGPGALQEGLEPGGYVLFVSTIEARKNHLLAFRVWRRMVDTLPPEEVPVLVFAGHVGWLVADLMQQLENCRFLDGRIVLVQDPGDAELAALYRGCRFTLFPSLYEGWGLPVTESLSFGKVCLASDRTSIPEAGGAFCLYYDPEDVDAAYEAIRSAWQDGAMLREREDQIRAAFRPTAWRETAEALLTGLRT